MPSMDLSPMPPAAGPHSEPEAISDPHQSQTKMSPKSRKNYKLLLGINYALLLVGSISSTLMSKYYFIHKGSSKWVSTLVQSAGFPLLILPVCLPFALGCTRRRPFSGFTLQLLMTSAGVGVLLGVNNLMFSWGNAYLPVSTSSLLISSQLAFNLILSVLIVKQKVNFLNLNCVVLLTVSSLLLGLSSNHGKPSPGLSHAKYWVGFFSTLGAGFLFALYLPVMETIYRKVYCYAMVVEVQLVMEVAATAFAATGMAVGGGFSGMMVESRVFDKGPAAYWAVIAGNVVVWQFCFMGTAGMVYLTTALTSGICMTALMVTNVASGVVVYGDEFGGVKAIAAAICVWGFCSYLYGMYRKIKKRQLIVVAN